MNRPSIRTAALGLAVALAAGSVTLASPALAAGDSTAPTLTGEISFSLATVDTTRGDADSTVSMQLHDASGVADATLTLLAPDGTTADVRLASDGTPTDGTWTGIQPFSSLDVTGKWTPTSLFVTDTVGNSATITGSALGSGSVTVTRTVDTVAPTLLDATTTVKAVDTTTGPADAVVRVSASDDLSGVRSGVVTFTNSNGDIAEGTLAGAPVVGNSLNGSWDVPVTFPQRSTPGTWRLSAISLADAQYVTHNYSPDDPELPGLSVRVATAEDSAPPSLTSFGVGPAKRSSAYRDGYVYAQVGFTDVTSGVDTIEVTLQRPDLAGGKPGATEQPAVVTYAAADLKTGTSRSGTVTVPIYVEGLTTGTWKVASVVLTDLAGNQTEVKAAQLPGTRTTFEVLSGTDTAAPTTSGHAFSPATIDTRTAGQDGSVLVAVADPDTVPSGVAGGTVTLAGPTGTQTTTATFTTNDLASGDSADGIFRAAFTLPKNSEDGAWTVTALTLTDVANHSVTITSFANAPTLTVLGAGRAPATAPDAPTIGAATISNTTASISWTAPANDGGAKITGYVVTAYRNGSPAGTYNAPGTSTTVPNLTRGQSYTFTVKARNDAGASVESAATGAIDVAAAKPGAPTKPTATLADTTATVTWDAPADTGGAAVTGYVVTPYLGSVAQPAALVDDVRSATITDLSPGRTYTFRVAAVNTVGAGTQSQPSNTVSVAATVPAAPRVASTRVAGTTATVAWDVPADGGAPITGYRVVGSPSGSCSTTATSCVVTGLTPDASYSFTVTATNGVGRGAESAPSPTVVASRPRVTALALGGTPARVVTGAAVVVTGRLTVSGPTAGVAGQVVRLQYRSGNAGWTTSPGAATTGPDGAVRIGFRPARTVQVRLVSPATGVVTAATSAARTITVSRVLTLGSRTTLVTRGRTVTLAGRAIPLRPGAVVTLQRRAGARWQSIAAGRVTGSTYSFVVRPTTRGDVAYRVITAGDASYATSVSNVRTLRVR